MNHLPSTRLSVGAGPAPASVSWTFDPWRERPRAAGIATLAVLAFWLAIVWLRFPLLIAIGLGAMAAAPLLPAFVPAACSVSAAGASRRGWRDATRALTLPMPTPRRAELRGLVRGLWGANGG